jgi:hypothetical protein
MVEWLALLLRIREIPAILIKIFRDFTKILLVNVRMVP